MLSTRIAGSSDLYQHHDRRPCNSINFITSHDGFTLQDLVSYNEKHNLSNGEVNRDGDNHNIVASEIAKHLFKVKRVISQIKDPLRCEAFEMLGIESVSPTILGADRIRDVMGT